MGSVPKPHLGIASGILATMRNAGMVLGIAMGGTVLGSGFELGPVSLFSPKLNAEPLQADCLCQNMP